MALWPFVKFCGVVREVLRDLRWC